MLISADASLRSTCSAVEFVGTTGAANGVSRPLNHGLLLRALPTALMGDRHEHGFPMPRFATELGAGRQQPAHTFDGILSVAVGQREATSIAKALISDWQVSGIFQAFSAPFTVTTAAPSWYAWQHADSRSRG